MMRATSFLAALSIALLSATPAVADEGVPVPDHDRPVVDTTSFDTANLDMVDDDALPQTQSLFAYLRNIGKAGHTLFGHQNDATDTIITSTTATQWSGVASDVYNAVGDFPAVHGYSPNQVEQVKDAYRKGAIIAVEHHVGNLSNGTGGNGGGGYGNVRNPNNPVEQVLPGGPKHDNLKAYLDNVARWASQYVDDRGNLIPVIYRPWHEHNGDWFWWTTSNATEGEFRELFRFTVDYLRDVKGVSNFIYAFSPNGHFENEEEYLYAYPGDEYVDLLGVDVYWDVPQGNPDWLDQLVQDLRIAVTYAARKGKIAALTETGIRWDASNGLKLQGAEYGLDWYTTMQTRIKADPVARQIAYMLVWRNGGTNHFWVPFKGHRVHGDHEMLPDFVDYYNRDDVVFASRVGDYTGLVSGSATVPNRPFASIHAPVAKKSLSGAVTVRVHAAAGHVTSTDHGTTRKIEASSVTVALGNHKYAATREPGTLFWTAVVDTTRVDDGRLQITATAEYRARDGRKVYRHTATDRHDVVVVNHPKAVSADPLLIDDFESYDDTGDNRTDLERVWWRDGSRMNSLRLRNSDGRPGDWTSRAWNDGMDTGTVLRMKYDAVGNADSQVTRPLDHVDWSGATSLGAWVQPDGKGYDLRFRFVVAGAGSAAGRTYEVSLNAGGARYGYDPASVRPQRVSVDLRDFRNVESGAAVTTDRLADVTSFSIRFQHQPGKPQMAGLNALEHYLFDDLAVR